MKLLLLTCVIMAAMNAQDFHGVSVSGTTAVTVTNNADKALLGWVMQRITSTGCNPIYHDVDYGALAKGEALQPGQAVTRQLIGTYSYHCRARDGSGHPMSVPEGEVTGYQILAVLFADGTFYGPDDLFKNVSSDISAVRSMARDAQYLSLEERNTVLQRHKFPPTVRNASTDQFFQTNRRVMAMKLLDIRDAQGDDAATAAIGQVAALPDVVKGE